MANTNAYEEARKQRLEENNRRFQDLGLAKIAKSLTDQVIKPKPKAKPKSTTEAPVDADLVRRSARPRSAVTSYAEEFVEDRPLRKKSRSGTSTRVKKPNEKVVTEAERDNAIKNAEDFRIRHVPSSHPSYIKSMLPSHVYNGFWLNVPRDFCEKYLTEEKITFVLEDNKGVDYDTTYIGKKTGLSGGWKAFSEDHKLDDGDALIFELTNPTRFKVHIFKGINGMGAEGNNKKPNKPKGRKSVNKVKTSDAQEDMVEWVSEQNAQPRERQTRNSKKAGGDF
ncbi:hypothetical protein MKW92_020811 [Papaver armeniacum]|nr:hypothetical protein MKW92_020811 [Papaver armeniacum]